jgi:hypothetical protein
VLVSNLAGVAPGRWPAFAALMAGTGMAALFAFPLQLGAVGLGVLTLYRRAAGRLSVEGLAEGLRVADTLALLLVGSDGGNPAHDLDARWLDRSARTREIDQATGMLIVQLGVGAEAAFARLRAHAFAHDRSLAEVARDVVARRLRLADDGG